MRRVFFVTGLQRFTKNPQPIAAFGVGRRAAPPRGRSRARPASAPSLTDALISLAIALLAVGLLGALALVLEPGL